MNQYEKLQKFISANSKITLREVTEHLECSEQYARQLVRKAMDANVLRTAGKGVWKSMSTEAAKDTILLPVKERFDYIEDLVHMVAKKVQPSILLTGTSGVGKSFLVQKTLAAAGLEKDTDYMVCKGHSSPLGLYQMLHDHRDQMLVFDDCDSVFHDDISANLMKAALDSYDKRYVSWHSAKVEQLELDTCFEFTGQIIFVSNMQANKIDAAIRGRSFCYNIYLSPNEVHEYMGALLPDILPTVDLKLKREVWEYLGKFKNEWDNFNLRILQQAIRVRIGIREGRDWKTMIQLLAQGNG